MLTKNELKILQRLPLELKIEKTKARIREWVDDIVKACDKANIRVFMKESLRSIMGENFRQDRLIWEIGE